MFTCIYIYASYYASYIVFIMVYGLRLNFLLICLALNICKDIVLVEYIKLSYFTCYLILNCILFKLLKVYAMNTYEYIFHS